MPDPDDVALDERSWRSISLRIKANSDRALAYENAAFSIAQASIRNGTLLNGGALIALPAFIQRSSLTTESAVWACIPFAIGLAASWLATFFMLSGIIRRIDSLRFYTQAVERPALPDDYSLGHGHLDLEGAAALEALGREYRRKSQKLAWVGFSLNALSFCLLVYGTFHVAWIILRG